MTAAEYRSSWNPSEAEFQRDVVDEARRLGWLVFHDYDPKRNESGLPDLIMVGQRLPPDGTCRLIFAELKRNNGRLRAAQRDWLTALEQVPGIEVYLWRPSMIDEIRAILAGDIESGRIIVDAQQPISGQVFDVHYAYPVNGGVAPMLLHLTIVTDNEALVEYLDIEPLTDQAVYTIGDRVSFAPSEYRLLNQSATHDGSEITER